MKTRSILPLRHHPAVWDLAIAVLVAIGVGGMVFGFVMVRQAHHDVWWLLLFLSLLALAFLLYGSFFEPRRISVNNKVIRVSGLPNMTIAIASDFHVGPFKRERYLRRVVTKLNALQPDLIVLPGDFLFDSNASVDALAPLQHLSAPLGVFAVLGNHDSGRHMVHGRHFQTADRSSDVERMLEECGITVLRDASIRLTHGSIPFALAGIDDLWMPSADLPRALLQIPSCLPLILLSHSPDVVLDPAASRAALILSGHTHGGQIRIPGIGPIAKLPSKTGRIYDQGIFAISDHTTLALTHGIGETMCRARLFCPPEILILRNKTD